LVVKVLFATVFVLTTPVRWWW